MTRQPELNEAEWGLVLDLLVREQHDLPQEIRHTQTNEVKDELTERRRLIDGLVDRLHQANVH